MKKTLMTTMLVMGLAGCQSNTVNDVQSMACYYPDAVQHEAPKWVCDVMPEGIAMGSVGYAKKSAAGMSVMRTIATNDARKRLAEQFETNVNTMFKQAMTAEVASTNESVSETVNEQFQSVTKNVSSRTLSNSRVIVSTSSPGGGLYTLVGMDQATYERNVAMVVEAAADKDSGLWKQFNDKKAEESLQKALDSML
ncbi:LPP20 family lipoprotein [Photobacterium sp. MCCC 1A19761]|uniref:LPP20 family lipoprotein n=1 Tax=Photobacterium sp. MCCC 1A19761 TaxID=3115000 RepID=UPI00307DD5FC